MITSQDALPIMEIVDNTFLSYDGSVSVNFHIINPEPYSLDESKFDLRHDSIIKALKHSVNDVFIQIQNVVIEDKYNSRIHYDRRDYITKNDAKHFHGKDTIINYTLLSFTLTGLKSLEQSYLANPLSYKENLKEVDLDILNSFFETVKSITSILKSLYNTSVIPMDENELRQVVSNLLNGFHKDNSLRDIRFGSRMEIGEHKYTVFSISDNSYLPDSITNVVDDDTLKVEGLDLKTGLMDSFGVFFPKNHIYNQIIHFKGHERLKAEFSNRIEEYGNHKSFSKSIEYDYKRMESIFENAIENNHTFCKAHFNIMTWDSDEKELKKKETAIKDILDKKEIRYYIPSFEGLENIFLGSIIGRQKKLSSDYFFLTTLEEATCLLTNYSFYQDDDEGIVFQTRLWQTPFRRDIWDSSKKRINAPLMIMFSPTGGGKSSTALNICQQFLEDGVDLLITEIGNSFEQLTKLYPNDSAHIKYTMNTPLGINPFDLNGAKITNDKLINLTELVLKFWQKSLEEKSNANIKVAVTKTIEDYYLHVNENFSFPSYYHYVIEHIDGILERNDISHEYFDISSFKLVCSQFIEGGIYENVCKGNDETQNVILNSRLVVFELKEVKKDAFLVSIILTILKDTQDLILQDKSKRSWFVYDELSQSQELVDSNTGNDILSTVSFQAETLRKENGGLLLIYQTPAQLPKNNKYAESIIDNMQILAVLDGKQSVYDAIVERFHIKSNEHINLMKSVSNDFNTERPYTELFLRYNENYAVVVRQEFSLQKKYAYQTDGEDWTKIQKDYERTGNIEESIDNLIKLKQ